MFKPTKPIAVSKLEKPDFAVALGRTYRPNLDLYFVYNETTEFVSTMVPPTDPVDQTTWITAYRGIRIAELLFEGLFLCIALELGQKDDPITAYNRAMSIVGK